MVDLGSSDMLFHMEQGAREMERFFRDLWSIESRGLQAIHIHSITDSNQWFAAQIEKAIVLCRICNLQPIWKLRVVVPLQRGRIC
jgi:hypothetical protein